MVSLFRYNFLIATEPPHAPSPHRKFDGEFLSSLHYKAKVNGHSLEQELREILTNAAPFTVDERVKVAEWLTRDNPWMLNMSVKAAIRTGRDDEYLNDLEDGESL